MAKYILRIATSCLLFAYIAFKVDWGTVASAFKLIRPDFYFLSTLVALICPVVMASKYHVMTKGTQIELSILRLTAINYISRFYAVFLPTALGPELVRWYKVTQNKRGRSFFLASTILERILFLLVLLAFGSIPLLGFTFNQNITLFTHQLAPILTSALFVLIGGLVFFFFPNAQRKLKQLTKKSLNIQEDSGVGRFLAEFELKHSVLSVVGPLFALTLLWQLFFVVRMLLLFWSLEIGVTLIDVAWMGSLVMLLQVLPITFAGLGVREGAYAYLFALYGFEAEKGVVLGMLFFSQMLIFASVGAILNVIERQN
ncbi:MAG: lysylphosphatidylglycerol synthase transmembrane domain-containing protein [Thermodesulfobacteriota bacterium]|nr:lysylphosphatidylglycerol synthase transmembrane domain-containing protein [Thermodesulfobacteriota bacterium]